MTDAYTFRYLKADGNLHGITVVQLNDWHSAEICAERLMPTPAAYVEIWCGGDLISKEHKSHPDTSSRSHCGIVQVSGPTG